MGDVFTLCNHRCHGVPDITSFFYREWIFILGPWNDAIFYRQVLAHNNVEHAWNISDGILVDLDHACVWMRTTDDFTIGQVGQFNIIGISNTTDNLVKRVDLFLPSTDAKSIILLHCHASPRCARVAIMMVKASSTSRAFSLMTKLAHNTAR